MEQNSLACREAQNGYDEELTMTRTEDGMRCNNGIELNCF